MNLVTLKAALKELTVVNLVTLKAANEGGHVLSKPASEASLLIL